MNDTIPCSRCKGTGRMALNGVYADTLSLLRSVDGYVYGAELARHDACSATAMNNRLAYLALHGFAVVRVYGRKTLYRAVTFRDP